MPVEEIASSFYCSGTRLIGILHKPAQPRRRGIVIVPGAPQYRIGSHRQFLLLARELAAEGFPVLRFDYRGMGDSSGIFSGFESVNEDIKSAVDEIFDKIPLLEDVVLWGLCDGASAIAFYAGADPRVRAIALVNPWVRSEETVAHARARHYYGARLLSAEFWRKLATGKVGLWQALREFLTTLWTLCTSRLRAQPEQQSGALRPTLPSRVAAGLRRFSGRKLILLSGADLTAQEFDSAVLGSKALTSWRTAPDVTIKRLNDANHTYSNAAWRAQIHAWTIAWLKAQD